MIDFLRALAAIRRRPSDVRPRRRAWRRVRERCSRAAAACILVTGHYGNWEIGSLLIRRALDLPLTVVAMAEADPDVNRIRREIRERLGAETIEVRQSLDTALQIRGASPTTASSRCSIDRHYRPRPGRGHDVRAAGVVPADAAADGVRQRRAGAALLHRAHRPGPLHAVHVWRADLRRHRSAARRGDRARRAAGRGRHRRPACARIRNTGITSTATGTRSATSTTGSPDAATWIPYRTRRSAGSSWRFGPGGDAIDPGRRVAAAVLGALAPDVDARAHAVRLGRYLRSTRSGRTHRRQRCLRAPDRGRRPPLRTRAVLHGSASCARGSERSSHVLLDLLSSARLRPLWPMIDRSISLRLVAMADPWLLALCASGR